MTQTEWYEKLITYDYHPTLPNVITESARLKLESGIGNDPERRPTATEIRATIQAISDGIAINQDLFV